MRLEVDGEIYVLEPLLSEPHMWKVVAEEAYLDEDPTKIQGLIMTYVDDIFDGSCDEDLEGAGPWHPITLEVH